MPTSELLSTAKPRKCSRCAFLISAYFVPSWYGHADDRSPERPVGSSIIRGGYRSLRKNPAGPVTLELEEGHGTILSKSVHIAVFGILERKAIPIPTTDSKINLYIAQYLIRLLVRRTCIIQKA